jgi:hypothetical protein
VRAQVQVRRRIARPAVVRHSTYRVSKKVRGRVELLHTTVLCTTQKGHDT